MVRLASEKEFLAKAPWADTQRTPRAVVLYGMGDCQNGHKRWQFLQGHSSFVFTSPNIPYKYIQISRYTTK